MTLPLAIPCRLYRGGTSRGLFFHDLDLPFPRDVREKILLLGGWPSSLGHPYGMMDGIEMDSASDPRRVMSATVGGTARLLMSGYVHVDEEVLRREAW